LLTIGLAYNLKRNDRTSGVREDYYAEFDDQSTVDAIASALSKIGEVVKVEADEDAYNNFRQARPDIVFNIAEGLKGESRESYVPALLEMLDIPYTGSGPLTLAIALNKAVTHTLLSGGGVRTPKHQVFTTLNDSVHPDLKFPLVVKPIHEGSSKGIWNNALTHSENELRERVAHLIETYEQPALVEEYVSGREFTIALLGNNPPNVLPIVEVRLDMLPPRANKLYSYEAKWMWDTCEHPLEIFECPARIPDGIRGELKQIALQTFRILGCRDMCRIDVRLDDEGRCYVLDVNPLPGMMPDPRAHSCLPEAARAAGLTYDELITSILFYALDRYKMRDLAPEIRARSSIIKE
jgi:D-alanine-D-alanine ligase